LNKPDKRPQPSPSGSNPYAKPGFKPRMSPMPIGDKCTPLCPLFRCVKGALVIVNKSYRGKMIKEAYCRLSGGKCLGTECQYSSCRINALLPDGKCAKALERKIHRESDEELFREMEKYEDYVADDFL